MLRMKSEMIRLFVAGFVTGLFLLVSGNQVQAAVTDSSASTVSEGAIQTVTPGAVVSEGAIQTVTPGAVVSGGAIQTVTPGAVVSEGAIKPGDTKEPEVTVTEPKAPAPKVKVASKLQVMKGKTKKITVKNARVSDFTWKSSKPHVATVTSHGKVKGISAGMATITAKKGKKTYKCVVKVFASKKYLSQWVLKKGRYYYYNEFGEKVTGKTTIRGKEYYFDSEGRQRVGWIRRSGNYYYYQVGKKGSGYMLSNQTVNGIRLGKDGAAKITEKNADKLRLYVYAGESVFEYTDSTMTRKEALRTMFVKLASNEIISYKSIGNFKNSSQWDVYYANRYFREGCGDCYCYASAMAYFAIALGYQDVYVCSSGGHGWCRVNGLYYDPRFANWGTSNMMDSFAVPESLCGKGGRMNWKKWSIYICKVD